jgi:serine/threonine protein kinase
MPKGAQSRGLVSHCSFEVQRALLRTAAEVAKGMDLMHMLGVVHGDLKPANVLLKTHRADRRGYVAKVADFGGFLPSIPTGMCIVPCIQCCLETRLSV